MAVPRLLRRVEPLDEAAAQLRSRRRVLILLASAGNVPQESLKPAAMLEAAGCVVTFATLDRGGARFDPLCILIAALELLWDPTLRLLWRMRRQLRDAPALRQGLAAGSSESWLEGFDAVVVPGGHGRRYAAFIGDPLLLATLAALFRMGRVLGLLCHAPMLLVLLQHSDPGLLPPLTVTCWPRRYERLLGALPLLGAYFKPFGRPVGETLARAGFVVHDPASPLAAVHATVDGKLVTGRGPWSTRPFTLALIRVLAETD